MKQHLEAGLILGLNLYFKNVYAFFFSQDIIFRKGNWLVEELQIIPETWANIR